MQPLEDPVISDNKPSTEPEAPSSLRQEIARLHSQMAMKDSCISQLQKVVEMKDSCINQLTANVNQLTEQLNQSRCLSCNPLFTS